jgi:type III restriction enzyme
MITVANRTETAARVKYALDHGRIPISELRAPDRTLHIDSKVLKQAEELDEPLALNGGTVSDEDDGSEAESELKAPRLTAEQRAELLRRTVDTIGQPGAPGEQIQSVISVGMLAEGWDARTVTHIMGLRAFTSQLLCEQVVGRGLRRTAYDVKQETGLFEPEYVKIFGVPFTFLPHEGGDGAAPRPALPKTRIDAANDKRRFELFWPNVIRVEYGYRPLLDIDPGKLEPLQLNAADVATQAELASILGGHPDLSQLSQIDLEELGQKLRFQSIVFQTAARVYDVMRPEWGGNREHLLAQIVGLVERFLRSDRVSISPSLFGRDPLRRRILLALNMNRIVHHAWQAIHFENAETIQPIFDDAHPVRSTGNMFPWYSGRPCHPATRSHINFCVSDSTWEAGEAYQLEKSGHVDAWAKNDHLGFEIQYVFNGVHKKYRPDFLVKLTSGKMLVLEIKGQDTPQDRAKRKALDEWVRAINAHGAFGQWCWDVALFRQDVVDILDKWSR